MSILITGGSGKLGREIAKCLSDYDWPVYAPFSSDFNICDYEQMQMWYLGLRRENNIVIVIHCAAQTSAAKCAEDIESTVDNNIIGTANVAKFCQVHGIKLVYISTDYVFDGNRANTDPSHGTYKETDIDFRPLNKYSKSKLAGEFIAKMVDELLIIRCSFTEREWPYPVALTDHYTSKEPVDVTAKKVVKLSLGRYRGIIHIGGKRQSVYEYARSLENGREIAGITSDGLSGSESIPKDSSLDSSLYDSLLNNQ